MGAFIKKTTTMESLISPAAAQTASLPLTRSTGSAVALDEFSRKISPSPSVPEVDRPAAGGADSEVATAPCSHPAGHLTSLFSATDYITGDQFEVAHCAVCKLSVTSPQPAADQIGSYYPSGYYGPLRDRRFPGIVEKLQQALYGWRVRQVESVAGPVKGRVLDVGCGRGLLLKEFRRRGWQVQGTELSEHSARYPREILDLPVETGSLETIRFPANHFDVITLWHVLEHVSDPQALLTEANRILKPGGVLLVSVPNFGGCEAKLFRDKWFHLDVPRHVTHLTKGMLEQALRGNGFKDRRWSGTTLEYDAFSFVQSALNKCGLRHNLLYDLLRGQRAKVIAENQAPPWQIPVTWLLAALFGLISVPLTLCAGLLGLGGTMTVLAVKQAEAPARFSSALEYITVPRPRRWART